MELSEEMDRVEKNFSVLPTRFESRLDGSSLSASALLVVTDRMELGCKHAGRGRDVELELTWSSSLLLRSPVWNRLYARMALFSEHQVRIHFLFSLSF